MYLAQTFNFIFADQSAKDNALALLDKYRLSCGLGVVLRLGNFARMELNYCLPVNVQGGDM